MSETKHTPGPWEISQEPPRWIIQSAGVPIGKKAIAWMVGDFLACNANARLITAAPDLLEAIEQALDDMRGDGLPVCQATKDQLRAAIAKATGEAP